MIYTYICMMFTTNNTMLNNCINYIHMINLTSIFFFFFLILFFCFFSFFFFFQAEDGIRDVAVTGVQTCALPISLDPRSSRRGFARLLRGAAAPLPRLGEASRRLPESAGTRSRTGASAPGRWRRR